MIYLVGRQGLAFHIGKDGPKIYEITIDRQALYMSTQFKNGSHTVEYLRSEEYVETEVPVIRKVQPTTTNKYGNTIWETS